VATDRSGPATIHDVARRAGVSAATVSRVLAGIGNPRPETVAAVTAAVDELGYRPSALARSLRVRRTRTLGLIVTDIGNPFFPELVRAADDAARARGYSILLGSAAYDERRATHFLDLMIDRRVDGVVVASSQVSAAAWSWLAGSPVPAVVVNAEPTEAPVTVITSDQRGGVGLAVGHLVELGHRRIAYVGGPRAYSTSAARARAFRLACLGAGLDTASTPVVAGDGLLQGGERAVASLLARDSLPTAIACFNDLTAIGVMGALRAAGLAIPGDVSVIGCDDIAAASWVSPALSTVAQQQAEMGRLSVEHLATALEHPGHRKPPAVIRLPMRLVVRGSTGPAPG